MKKTIYAALFLLATFLIAGNVSYAQDTNAEYDKYISLMRKDLRSEKKQFIALNMTLTDKEATKFWPVYDRYSAELSKIYDQRVVLIKDYAAAYETLTNAQAAKLITRASNIDTATTSLRQKYVPLVGAVLPGKKSAFFFQLDKRIGLLIDLQLASEIPFVIQ